MRISTDVTKLERAPSISRLVLETRKGDNNTGEHISQATTVLPASVLVQSERGEDLAGVQAQWDLGRNLSLSVALAVHVQAIQGVDRSLL